MNEYLVNVEHTIEVATIGALATGGIYLLVNRMKGEEFLSPKWLKYSMVGVIVGSVISTYLYQIIK